MPLAQVLDVYFPNRMSGPAKVWHYAARVWEFVSGEPRESNTEGGVFPAIFGTIMLIFLMSILSFPLGVLAGIERGWFQQALAESAYAEQQRYESGDLIRVGVNAFADDGDRVVDTLVIGEEAERSQRARVARTRAGRDPSAAAASLAALTVAAATDANLVDPLVTCARAGCTEGEMVAALTGVFGEYRETPRF